MYLWQFEQPSKGMKGLHFRASTRRERKLFADSLAQIKAGESKRFKLRNLKKFDDMGNYRWKRHGFDELTVQVVESLERPTMVTNGNTAIWTLDCKELWETAGHYKDVEFHEEWITTIWLNGVRCHLYMWWDDLDARWRIPVSRH